MISKNASSRRVLFLGYYFPPIGGAGAQRITQLARYLPQIGYHVSVITGPAPLHHRWTPLDGTMGAQIDHTVEIHRIEVPEPGHGTSWRLRAERWLRIGPRWRQWWYSNTLKIGRRVGAQVDVIHAFVAPWHTADAARALARELGKPLVVDLEDPWALDEMMIFPSAVHRRLELNRMRRTLASAAAVVMNTSEAARRVLDRFPELRRKIVRAIPNGFDSADFGGPTPRREDGKYRIVHTGSLHTELGLWQRQMPRALRMLGGGVAGVDLLTRSHLYLLEAIDRLITERPELASIIEVHFAGALTEADRTAMKNLPLVRQHGFLPHRDTIELLRSADLLFLPMHNLPWGRRAGIVPCKTYEYLASGRPVLAAVPDGDARDLLAESGIALLCRPADVNGMRDILSQQLRRFEAGEPAPMPRADVLARFGPQRLTQDLATVLDEVCSSRICRRVS